MAQMASDNKSHGSLNANCPVCDSDFTNGLTSRHQGTAYDLCSIECKQKFDADPSDYQKDG